jgi:hypothetical protein
LSTNALSIKDREDGRDPTQKHELGIISVLQFKEDLFLDLYLHFSSLNNVPPFGLALVFHAIKSNDCQAGNRSHIVSY